jgi:hypothetical protein
MANSKDNVDANNLKTALGAKAPGVDKYRFSP